jgi:SAM-dependent methyltransferase
VLEVGSGIGGELAWLLELGARPADLVGVDLLADRVAEARLEHPDLRFEVADGQRLDFPRASFDLVLALTLFSSILEPSRRSAVATEMSRVLRPGGAILWYDVRVGNPRNPNLLAMPRAELKRLFPTLEVKARSITVAPPLARRLGPLTGPLYPVLAAIPALRSHLLATIQERG